MAVVLGTYRPDLQCRGTFGAWTSCRSILGDMPVLTTTEIFGPPDIPTVQIPLPHFLESGWCGLSFHYCESRSDVSYAQMIPSAWCGSLEEGAQISRLGSRFGKPSRRCTRPVRGISK